MTTIDFLLLCDINSVYFYVLIFRKAVTIILMQAISKFLTNVSSVHKVYKIHLWGWSLLFYCKYWRANTWLKGKEEWKRVLWYKHSKTIKVDVKKCCHVHSIANHSTLIKLKKERPSGYKALNAGSTPGTSPSAAVLQSAKSTWCTV